MSIRIGHLYFIHCLIAAPIVGMVDYMFKDIISPNGGWNIGNTHLAPR
ncbi:hypothetical protein [Candidatus Doolittlea endobia]|nr:hypothetical protein [Candidatus Doolittlea endobia]